MGTYVERIFDVFLSIYLQSTFSALFVLILPFSLSFSPPPFSTNIFSPQISVLLLWWQLVQWMHRLNEMNIYLAMIYIIKKNLTMQLTSIHLYIIIKKISKPHRKSAFAEECLMLHLTHHHAKSNFLSGVKRRKTINNKAHSGTLKWARKDVIKSWQ